MGSEVRPLESLCSLVVDCPHSTPAWTESGHVVLRNQNIRNGRLDLSAPSFTDSEHFAQRNRRATPTSGDIVITREAPMGEVCMIPEGLVCCLGQRQVLLRPDPQLVNPKFLLFALQSPGVQHQIGWNEGTGSTVSNLRIPVLKSLSIPTPDRALQDAVAAMLGAIDDRIDNLRQTNATLEAIAQALFKSWFVDFDPVRAKAEGREPEGMDAATAALFPSEFEDSELGPIPKGWEVEQIGKLVSCLGGATPSTKDESFWQEGIHHWATPKDLSGLQSPVLVDTDRRITDAGLSKISSGLLPAGTLLLSSRAPIGYLAIAAVPTAINQGFIAMPPGGELSPLFLLCWCKENMGLIKQSANGSTFMEISKKAFRPLPVCVPAVKVSDAFDQLVGPIIDKITANEQHRHSLTELRDALLPRLISGKLRLPEADNTLEKLSA